MKDADLQRIDKYLFSNMNNQEASLHAQRRTKIVATVGPASSDYDTLVGLVKAGVNVFRLNFSHGTHEQKKQIIEYIQTINRAEPYNIAILGDLQGPKLRVGDIEGGQVEIVSGQLLKFTSEKCVGTKDKIYVSYPFLSDIKIDDRILLDDGKLTVKTVKIASDKEIIVEVINGGILKPQKGFNLPDTATSLPSLTDKDREDLEFIIAQQIDWIALSFVRKAQDIRELRDILQARKSSLKIIAKIEKPEAVLNIQEIVKASDGIMVARGDLGVEVPVEKVPLIQKSIIGICIKEAKPVIVATQMMESMIENVQLNRSEATDVANSVLDGSDAVMLSGETATGKHPILVVQTMQRIINEVETAAFRFDYRSNIRPNPDSPSFLSEIICYSTCDIASTIKADAIIGMTQSGRTSFVISSYRPRSPIYIFTKIRAVVRQLSLSWGVRAFYYDEEESIDKIFSDLVTILEKRKFIKEGDTVVHTGSIPIREHLPTNMIKVTKVGPQ